VIERECELKPILGKPAPAEECARVIDQDVETLLPVSDMSGRAFHLGDACEISKIYGVGDTRCAVAKTRRVVLPRILSRAIKTIRAPLFGEYFRGYLSNAGGAARNDNGLASHERSRPC
jgi:hypothetical protein